MIPNYFAARAQPDGSTSVAAKLFHATAIQQLGKRVSQLVPFAPQIKTRLNGAGVTGIWLPQKPGICLSESFPTRYDNSPCGIYVMVACGNSENEPVDIRFTFGDRFWQDTYKKKRGRESVTVCLEKEKLVKVRELLKEQSTKAYKSLLQELPEELRQRLRPFAFPADKGTTSPFDPCRVIGFTYSEACATDTDSTFNQVLKLFLNFYHDNITAAFKQQVQEAWDSEHEVKTDQQAGGKMHQEGERRDTYNPLMKSPNIILYGPPGTGKTYATVSVAAQLIDPATSLETTWDGLVKVATTEKEQQRNTKRGSFAAALGKRIHFITFHQSYSYEDFIGGLRPNVNADDLKFEWQPGIFLRACAAAFKQAQSTNTLNEQLRPGEAFRDDVDEFLRFCNTAKLDSYKEPEGITYPPVILVIDEINRANMSRVFGELITLLEEDKRLGGKEQLLVQLPNRADCKFGVPKNLIIIGTMNTADKSLALLDLALRRRFEFHRLDPNPEKVTNEKLKKFLTDLNKAIAKERKSLDYGIGHAYFMREGVTNENVDAVLTDILQRKIVPLLQEYFGGDDTKVIKILAGAGVDLVTEPKDEKNERNQWIKVPVECKPK